VITTAPATSRSLLQEAVRRKTAFSRAGLLEYIFSRAFEGLVYAQIWEDPDIDMEALAITPQSHVVAIASGGCNILSYLAANPAQITAVDLNVAHVALTRLKLAAAVHLPSWVSFHRFFGAADERANIAAYWRYLAPVLDADTRGYWERRRPASLGRRRIAMFSRNIYRRGLLGRFIGVGHAVARAYGVDLRDILRARSIAEQRCFYRDAIAPLFDKRLVRWTTNSPLSLYGLGIPPAQYAALGAGRDMAGVLRKRIERLTCDFSLRDNYFAWQAFGRSYPDRETGPLPPYLRRDQFPAIRARTNRVAVLNRSVTAQLETLPAASVDRFVLLDAQDWMTDVQLNALWHEVTRTARPAARVIFRTAAEPSLLPGRLDPRVLSRWRYQPQASRDFTARDRSAIYGGFHLYVLGDDA
jgi:S-adenosylmethionine-diacylglycerol 3-amino-3-carboxypropyl transferase